MLVLSRKCGESLMISDEIEVTITEISGDKVKVGISAPSNFKILRKELYQTIRTNRQSANGVAPKDILHLLEGME